MSASYVVGVLCCLELPGHALVTIPNMITVLVALCAGLAPSRTIAAQVQTRLLVQAIDPLVVDLPEPSRRNSTTAQQHEDAPEPVTHACGRNFLDTLEQRAASLFLGLVVPARMPLLHHCTGAANAHAIPLDQMASQLLALG